jgi:hypothetical protein
MAPDRNRESRDEAPAGDAPDDALERHDREHALTHELDRLAPSRHAQWPKGDQRSSSRLTEPDDLESPRTDS